MAMMDYGAIVKKNGKIISDPKGSLFQNFSTLCGGELYEEYQDILFEGDKKPTHTLIKHEYVGDESVREYGDGDKISVIHNYMAVVGDGNYLIATYKYFITIFDNKEAIASWYFGQDDQYYENMWHTKRKIVKYIETPFGSVKVKEWSKRDCGTAVFNYKGDRYEILFGYGIDPSPRYIFSKGIYKYLGKKLGNKVRQWYKGGECCVS